MTDKHLDVLVICGSLRKGSFNAIVQRALEVLLSPQCFDLSPAHVLVSTVGILWTWLLDKGAGLVNYYLGSRATQAPSRSPIASRAARASVTATPVTPARWS